MDFAIFPESHLFDQKWKTVNQERPSLNTAISKTFSGNTSSVPPPKKNKICCTSVLLENIYIYLDFIKNN